MTTKKVFGQGRCSDQTRPGWAFAEVGTERLAPESWRITPRAFAALNAPYETTPDCRSLRRVDQAKRIHADPRNDDKKGFRTRKVFGPDKTALGVRRDGHREACAGIMADHTEDQNQPLASLVRKPKTFPVPTSSASHRVHSLRLMHPTNLIHSP